MKNSPRQRLLKSAGFAAVAAFLGYFVAGEIDDFEHYMALSIASSAALGTCIVAIIARGMIGKIARPGVRSMVAVVAVVLGAVLGGLSSTGHFLGAQRTGFGDFVLQAQRHVLQRVSLPHEPIPRTEQAKYLERERLYCFRFAPPPVAECIRQAYAAAAGLEALPPSQRRAE